MYVHISMYVVGTTGSALIREVSLFVIERLHRTPNQTVYCHFLSKQHAISHGPGYIKQSIMHIVQMSQFHAQIAQCIE